MGLRRSYVLVCDECGATLGNDHFAEVWFGTPTKARATAKRQGWYRYKATNGGYRDANNKDLCPACADAFLTAKEGA